MIDKRVKIKILGKVDSRWVDDDEIAYSIDNETIDIEDLLRDFVGKYISIVIEETLDPDGDF